MEQERKPTLSPTGRHSANTQVPAAWRGGAHQTQHKQTPQQTLSPSRLSEMTLGAIKRLCGRLTIAPAKPKHRGSVKLSCKCNDTIPTKLQYYQTAIEREGPQTITQKDNNMQAPKSALPQRLQWGPTKHYASQNRHSPMHGETNDQRRSSPINGSLSKTQYT